MHIIPLLHIQGQLTAALLNWRKNTFFRQSFDEPDNALQPVQILFPPYLVGNLAVLVKNTRALY